MVTENHHAKILIVDDQLANVRLIERLLQRAGYSELASTTDSREALPLFQEFQPDLVLLDLLMPYLDGHTVMAQMKAATPEDAYLPIVILTADTTDASKEEALRGGATDFLTKPFDNTEVLLRVANLLETRRLHLQIRRQNERLEERVEERTRELERLQKLSALISDISTRFVTTNADGVDDEIRRALQTIGEFTGADRSYIFLLSPGRDDLHNTHGWVAPGVDERYRTFREIPKTLLPRWIQGLGRYHSVQVRNVSSAPEDLPEKAILLEQGIKSLVIVPIVTGTELLGFLGFDTVREEKTWREETVDRLRIIGEIFGSVLARQRAENEVRRQMQRLAALRAIDIAIATSQEMDYTLSVFLEQVTAQLEVDAAAVLLLDKASGSLQYVAGRGFQTAFLPRAPLRVGEGYAGRAVLERRLVRADNLHRVTGTLRRDQLPPPETLASEEGHPLRAYFAVPLIMRGEVKGVLELFHRSNLRPDPAWLDYLETLAGQGAIAIDNAGLFEDLQRSNADLIVAYDATIEGWARALDLRDHETEGHSRRVTELTIRMARAAGLSEAEVVQMRRGALLHDIGKMGIPDSILLKAGKLTDEEWEIMKRHPHYGYALLLPIDFLHPALDIPYCHHEKWDGTGYPRGLKGEQIPFAARIFAVVDVWDALHSDRPYRKGWPTEKILAYLREESGKHFDPRVVDLFLRIIEE